MTPAPVDAGMIGPAPPPPADSADQQQVSADLAAAMNLDTAGLLARYPSPKTSATLGYDPLSAANLDVIGASTIGLSDAEKGIIGQSGFMISDRVKFPGFTYGYQSIYAADLPVFVSADSIMYAVHRSYDSILENLEYLNLRSTLVTMLQNLRTALAGGAIANLSPATAADVDLYLAVPIGLLAGTTAPGPVAGASATQIADLIADATAASGTAGVTLFGSPQTVDFSQFTPRGHYTDLPDLQTYFKAMVWLGRFELQLIQVQSDGSQVFNRQAFDGALGLTELLAANSANPPLWQAIDSVLNAFVGEPDSMQPSDFPTLTQQLGVANLTGLSALDDATISAALISGGFGSQRIASQILVTGVHDQVLPLPRSFLLLGQRYVVDSHVFSNVTYDRVPPSTTGRLRMLPDPLDVAFAVFANNQAAALLAPQLDTFQYAPALASMRVLVDDHGDSFWSENLYNDWLGALRTLSPDSDSQSGPFAVTGTDAWGRRLLQTQLASWAELRHDTILYVKQSYGTGVLCVFPDALVEPNPAFFAKVADFAAKGQAVASALPLSAAGQQIAASVVTYFQKLGTAATTLRGMAEAQAAGTPFTDDQMTFINDTVRIQHTCGLTYGVGWYPDLFFDASSGTDFDPTIADVHTAPTDEAGDPVGNVLHVGTGYARLMVVTANTCDGPKAYAGLASSYFEDVTQNLQRLDDPTWTTMLNASPPPPDIAWMNGLIAR